MAAAYRIHKTIRDMLIFSEHDLIKNPPFSKLDLISCRNLLIYMGAELQKKLMPLFHYALNPGGMLVLGSSESVGDFVNLFAPVERKSRIFQRQAHDFGPHRMGIPGLFERPPGNEIARRAGKRRAERQQTSAARDRRTRPPGALLPGWRAGQRTRRHPLPAGPHRPVPGTDSGRGQHEYLQDGSRRVARRSDDRSASGCVAGIANAPPGLTREKRQAILRPSI